MAIKISIEKLYTLLGLPTQEEVDERLSEMYIPGPAMDREEDETDEAFEARWIAAEEALRDEAYQTHKAAVERAADGVFASHKLSLDIQWEKGRVYISPVKKGKAGWDDVGRAVIDTINGDGTFHYTTLREAVYTSSSVASVRAFVESHLGWLKRRADVYGELSASHTYNRYLSR